MSVFNWLRSPTRQRQQKRRQSAERRQRLSRYLSTIRPILGIERLESRVMLDAQGFDFPGRAYDVGDRPESVVAADVDGDGHIDLITANSVSNTVSVLRSLGDGTFATQVTYDVGHYPASIVAADINGDGHVDLITANRNSGTVSVLRNLENGIFAAQVTYAVGTNPRSVSVADIDGDGQIDLVTANHGSDTVSVLRNFGDGTFASQATYDVGRSPGAVVAADLDGNGRVDLVTANQSSGTVSVLRNIDDGTFASHVTYEIGGSEYGVANFTSLVAADLNGDGYIDLVARSNGSYTASVLTNFGDGTFASQVAYTVGGQGYYVTAADIDGDGHVDLVSTGAGGVYIMRNRADGTFASRVRYAMDGNFWSVTAADFDGDGHIDLAITAGTSFGVVFVLQNVGDGVLGSEDIYAEQRLHRYMTGADFNGDGYVDLVSIDLYGEITVLRNQGDGTFAPGGMHPGARAIHGSTTDVDGDGHIDLVTAGWNFIAVFRNLGDGTFELWSTYDVSEPAVFVEATDVDGDGRIDLVIVNNVGQLSVLRDIADGTFPTREPYTVGGTPRSVAVADIDGDGRVDLITTIDNDDSGILSILKNRGDGTFSSPVTYAVDKNPRSVTAADIDGDGHVDLITANYDSDTISVLRNSGNGTFAPQVTYDAGRFLWAVTVADLDGDGHIDLATLNQTNNFGTVSVLRNHGDGTFATEATYAVGSNTFSVVALDLDGDGYVDLATAGSSGVFVLRNQARPNGGGISNDLFVSVVSVQPDSVNLGQTVQVEYNVQNIGEQAAQGNWFDSIYLSRNTTFDSSDLLLDRVRHENGLESEQGYTRSVNVSIPAFAVFEPGDWHILVRTDSSNRVPESDKTNNLGVSSPITINQQVTTLALGETFVGEIAAGQSMYFQVDYTQNEPLAFRLDGLPANGIVELFVNRDGLPSRTYFDRTSRSPFVNSQYIYLPPQVEGGRFYVLIHAPTLMDFSTNFELTAWVPEFGVLTRSFGTAGNAGEFTLQAIGAAFDSTITARLINDKGNEFTSKSHHVDDPTRYYATFDMRDVPRGTYDVVFTNSVGMEVTVPQSLDVIIALENSPVVPRVIVPSAVRRGLPYSFIIEWENMSQNDAYAPILTVGNSVPFGTSRNDLNSLGTQHMFLGVNTQEGPAGILRPGQRERVTFWSYSDSEPGEHSIWVDRIDLTDEFDWDGVKLQMWPSYLSEEEFESIFQQLVDQVGRTWGDFQGMLSRNASLLPYPREQLREFSHSLVLAIDDLTALQRPSITGRLLGMVEDFAMPPVFAEHTVTKEHSKATIRIDGSFVFPAIEPGTYRLFVPSYELNGSPDVTIEVGGSELIGDLTISPSTLSIYQQLLNAGVDEEIATMIVSGDIFSEEFDFSAFSFDFGETHQRPGATSMLDAMAEVIARGTWESTVFSHGLLKATALEYWLRRWNLASYHLNSFLDAAGRDLNYVAGSTVSEMAKHDTVGYFNHREAAKKVEAAVRELAMKKLAMGELAPFSLSMEDLLRTAGLQSFPGPNFYKSPNDILPHNDLSAAFGDMGGSKRLGINHSVEVVVRNGVSVRGSGGDWRPIQWVASIRYLWEDDYSFWNDQAKSVFDRAGYYLENIVGSAKPFRTTIEIIESIHVGGPTPLFPYDGKSVYRPGSVDPNDIIGPAGYGTESHIVASATMPYTIRFENDPEEATAPAGIVTITQTLDANLDWTTFRLGDIGFGEFVVEVPPDTAFFQSRYDVTAELGVFVDIEAGIDIATGQVYWQFTSIDPDTGDLPENPFLGFLPPNINAPEGDGFVTYTILPKSDLTTGDRIDAMASIVFDVNEAILTPPIFHTIDGNVPSSAVTALPSTVGLAFEVTWAGSDNAGGVEGARVAVYHIYVSVDEGPYELWLANTAETSALFEGEVGKTYAFYSLAIDGVGHREQKEAVAEATTTVVLDLPGGENAATILRVTTTLDVIDPDDGVLSLREAIIHANQNPGDYRIELQDDLYMLTLAGADEDSGATGDLDIRAGVRVHIVGPEEGFTEIDGGFVRDAETGEADSPGFGDRLFDVFPGGQLTLQNLEIRGGNAGTEHGGAVRNAGEAFLIDVDLSFNQAQNGGAVANSGSLTVVHSYFYGNHASGDGGAFYNASGEGSVLRLNKSIVFDNAAENGGVLFNRGRAEIVGSYVGENMASNYGGAILNHVDAVLQITSSQITSNDADTGGGLFNWGTVTIDASTFDMNLSESEGGAIYHLGDQLNVTISTFTDNSAGTWGGGLMLWTSANISHSTIFNNVADADGNGDGWADGIFAMDDVVYLSHSIVLNNGDSGAVANDVVGQLLPTSRYNVVGNARDTGLTDGQSGNQTGVDWRDVLQEELETWDGIVWYHPLVTGGPAVDAGDPDWTVSLPGLAFDQRGNGFPRVGNGRIDIGAYESGNPPPTTPPLTMDRFEPNEIRAFATDLGPVAGTAAWESLSIAPWFDVDWYRFSTVGTGSTEHQVRLNFHTVTGDIDMELYDASGMFVAGSWSMGDGESVSLAGLPAAEYVIRVYSLASSNYRYDLIIDAPEQQTPNPPVVLIDEDFEDGSIDGFVWFTDVSGTARIVDGDSYGPGNHALETVYTTDEQEFKLEYWSFGGETLQVEFAMKLPDGLPIEETQRQWGGLKTFHIWTNQDRSEEQPMIGLLSTLTKYTGEGPGGTDRWQFDTINYMDWEDSRWYIDIEPPIDQWMHIRYFIHWNDPGVSNGVLKMWINDVQVIDSNSVLFLGEIGDTLDGLWIGGNLSLGGDNPDRPFRRLVDDVRVSTGGGPSPWQNPVERWDVNANGFVEPLDALLILNHLMRTRRDPGYPAAERYQKPYYDVNGDGHITAIDALHVLNELRRRSRGGAGASGEGVAMLAPTTETVPATFAPPIVVHSIPVVDGKVVEPLQMPLPAVSEGEQLFDVDAADEIGFSVDEVASEVSERRAASAKTAGDEFDWAEFESVEDCELADGLLTGLTG